jgi:hypothetical protein
MLPDTIPHGRAYLESRKAVDDGYIWPFARHEMVAPGAIVERMVEDIAGLVNDGGDAPCVTLDDLTRCGWRPEQTAAYGARAFKRFEEAQAKPKRRQTGNRSTVRRHGYRQEAAALACFALPILILYRQMMGV